MQTIDNFAELINKSLAELKFPSSPAGLYDPIRYTFQGGGKRLRPVLLLASCEAVSGTSSQALNQALGIEMFHNFTLLHDDVMDRADIRRGRPTVHRRWNESTAILSGDAMLTLATQLIADCHDSKLRATLDIFNTTAMEIYHGQQLDMDFEHLKNVSVDEYIEMIRLKTSVLLGAACKIGALIGNADARTQASLYEYGVKLGLAFQLRDDYLDTFGDPLTFGKEIGGDIVNNKKTWLLINAAAEDPDALDKALNQSLSRGKKIAAVTALYENLGLPERCIDIINRYVADAVNIIRGTSLGNDAKEFFTTLALSTIERNN